MISSPVHAFIYSAAGNIIALIHCSLSYIFPNKELKAFMMHHNVDQTLLYYHNDNQTHVSIINHDLTYAQQCGNGLRALAHHLSIKKVSFIIDKKRYCAQYNQDQYWVNMGQGQYLGAIQLLGHTFHDISMGNQHALVILPNLKHLKIPKELCHQYNVSFMNIQSSGNITIKTFERGVGWTQACASACSAATFLANRLHPDQNRWTIYNPGGMISTHVHQSHIYQTGPVKLIKQDVI